MSDIERFNLFTQDWCIEMRTQNGGPWVKYEDHIARIRVEQERNKANALAFQEGYLKGLDVAKQEVRENAIKECAAVCDQQSEDFRSPQYATNQPLGSFLERFACDECKDAILSLLKAPSNQEGGK